MHLYYKYKNSKNGKFKKYSNQSISILLVYWFFFYLLKKLDFMRTTKQLLELMLKHKGFFHCGLCHWALYLYENDLFTRSEYRLLIQYIKENKPEETYDSVYYFEPSEIAPRIRWINQQINKL